MNDEYTKQINMSYIEQCHYLQKKYGMAKFDYFATVECKSKNKNVSRTKEGLFCHHIFENIRGNLGEPHMAQISPYEYQQKENLAYCNYIEHAMLHLKIDVMSYSEFNFPFEITHFFNSNGFFWICEEINSLFKNNGSSIEWRNNCFVPIQEEYQDYVDLLQATFCFIETHYHGKKEMSCEIGSQVVDESINVTNVIMGEKPIIKRKQSNAIVKQKDDQKYTLLLETGQIVERHCEFFEFMCSYRRQIKRYMEIVCLIPEENIVWEKLFQGLQEPFNKEHYLLAKALNNSVINTKA